MTETVIDVRDLVCRYGDFEAVRGVSLDVARGELFALLGTNGAGKTTTLETLEGHRKPASGTVRVLGADPIGERVAVRARTGIMLQHSGFAPDLTVIETIRLWGDLSTRDGSAEHALERLDLGHRRDVRVKQLSGGERRRLDLAMATYGDPPVLFLDEPTTGLDPESRKRTWDVVRDLLSGGTTVLLTTHYLEEAESLAHRLAIMHEGRIAVSGSLTDVLARRPASIRFDLPHGVAAGDLPVLSGDVDGAALTAGQVRVDTRELQHDLGAVLDWARNRSLRLSGLRAAHASLDEVFHAVRDGATVNEEVGVR
ncbi:ABC-2 type transport system ATP-binding protein [Herbihabitans rhizosphaerae]|uniref:ABC-2 type transport system ATP-binding protein n=1 Tax=Herbihabitans rhizosphaerae TaxID=1872711 RepID=A0A4Q7L2E1_9PSEU|nr:ABC transporter ATP-binding protein [Herbihabitans rhizosphaerae]RZS43377.1 ABC-2 type transport system ATP-binding protein [Herbihabitans rhizosphaerae]